MIFHNFKKKNLNVNDKLEDLTPRMHQFINHTATAAIKILCIRLNAMFCFQAMLTMSGQYKP